MYKWQVLLAWFALRLVGGIEGSGLFGVLVPSKETEQSSIEDVQGIVVF